MSYISLIENLISPLIHHQEDLRVKEFPSEDDQILIQVMVNQEDLGKIIGKQGKTINAIRTIVYAAGSKESKKIRINVDSY
ncbi:MAG TPA: RNA-binding protein [Firmicutes bacterium]|nr:RNA-binding protein [Bacillota bacterium]